MPPLTYSRMHSLIILTSSSECFSSADAGGGAVEETIVPITSAGSPFSSRMMASRSTDDEGFGNDSLTTSGLDGKREPRLDSLLQNERRDASALAIGTEGDVESDDGVETPERSEGVGDVDRGDSSVLTLNE